MFQLFFENQSFQSKTDFQLTTENDLLQEALTFCRDWMNGESNFSQQTSGSTGTPTLRRLERRQLEASAKATYDFFKIQPSYKLLCCLHPRYIAGKMMLVRAMCWNLPIRLVAPGKDPLQQISEDFQPDWLAMVPLQVGHCLKNPRSKTILKNVRQLLIGGAPLPEILQKQLVQEGIPAFLSFGMTETVSHIALAKIEASEPIYRTLPSVTIGQDHRGALWIKSPMSGAAPIQTNDLVELLASNQFHWRGRLDFVVNSGGIKLSPEILEQKIESTLHDFFPGRRFFLGGMAHPQLGQQLILLLENEKQNQQKAFNLLEKLKEKLPRYAIPKEIRFLDAFAETGSGKIDRLKTLSNA